MAMPRSGPSPLRALVWGSCLLVPVYTAAQQQQSGGGLSVLLDYSEQLVIEDSDNETDNEDSLTSSLDLSLRSITRQQTLSFDIGGNLEKPLSDLGDTDFTEPRLTFLYGIESRNTAFQASALYREAEISRLTAVDILGETALVLADGDREDLRLSARLEFGRASPFGGSVAVARTETSYSGPGTQNLFDSESHAADVALRFNIDPRITGRAVFSLNDLDRDGGRDVRSTRAGLGASLAISETLTSEIEVGTTRIEQGGFGTESSTRGAYYTLGLVQNLPNGNLRGSLGSDISENGRRTTLQVDRQFIRKRDQLSFGVGLSQDDDSDTLNPLYSFAYSRPLKRGSIAASLEQTFGTNNAGDERLDTRLNLSVRQELTPLSSVAAVFNVRDASVPGEGVGDQQQINVGLDYTRTLTDDWQMVAGYSHSRQDRLNGTERDNRIYLGLRLRREWRP